MSDLDDILARLPPRPRVPTGLAMLDAVLGGGFPDGLTIVACDDDGAVDTMASICRPLTVAPHSTRLKLLFHAHEPIGRVRRYALLYREAFVLVREPREEVLDDIRVADVYLRAASSNYGLIIEAVKNQGRPLDAVRFTTAGMIAEVDVVPAA